MVRLGLIQMRCEKTSTTSNLEAMKQYFDEALRFNLDFLCFPEMSITGYADPTNFPQAGIKLDGAKIKHLLNMTSRKPTTAVLAGMIEENPYGKPYITQIVIQDGKLLGYYRKIRIVDEEAGWFSPGKSTPTFKHGELIFGIAICADISSNKVFAEYASQGAKIVFEAAAPGLYGAQATRDWQAGFDWWKSQCQKYLSIYAKEYKLWIAVATQAGRTIDEDFPGGGYLFAPDGSCVYASPDWLPGAAYLEIDLKNRRVIQL
jgi:predicted amidohydrolase